MDDVCVVITAKLGEDDISYSICKELADTYAYFTDCNDEQGRIIDFSLARNHCLSLAKHKTVMWIDSDDILQGADKLAELIKVAPDNACYMFPYEYAYDNNGNVAMRHYRERLVMNKDSWHFVAPVHEVLVPNANQTILQIKSDEVVFKHQRQFISDRPTDPGRNLRILKNYVEKTKEADPRQLYYLGLEYSSNNDLPNAIKTLARYVELDSWQDEKAMAYYKLVELNIGIGNYNEALKYSKLSSDLKYDWFESYYALCKSYYFLKDFHRSAYYGKHALNHKPTETLLFINPNDRIEILDYLNVSFNHIGDVNQALAYCEIGLNHNPDNHFLLTNKKLYEKHLNIKETIEVLPEGLPEGKLNIVFVAGDGLETWTPETVKKTGIGGSELMLIHQAKNLAALGHKVRVYSSCGKPGVFDGVKYFPTHMYRDLTCDVLVVSRMAPFLGDEYNISAKLKLLWLHDIYAVAATSSLLSKADRIIVLSQWHKQSVLDAHPAVGEGQIIVSRNGIDLTRFKNKVTKNKFKCVNSSSPDRSYPILLECWKEIVKLEPRAELHLFYGFSNWKMTPDKMQQQLIVRLEEQIKNTSGVVFHDRVSQEELANEFLSAGIWLYPTFFTETSCISAMEAKTSSLHMITSPIAALVETAPEATFISGEWTSEQYKQDFIKATLEAFNVPIPAYNVSRFDILSLAQEWSDLFLALLSHKSMHPVLPYKPTSAYENK